MATPRLPSECQDCGEGPREGRSTRCEACRAAHRRDRQTETQRRRREQERASPKTSSAASTSGVGHPPDPLTQERIHAVVIALRYSTPYVEHLHDRIGPTPYLDNLHDALRDLLSEMRRLGYRATT